MPSQPVQVSQDLVDIVARTILLLYLPWSLGDCRGKPTHCVPTLSTWVWRGRWFDIVIEKTQDRYKVDPLPYPLTSQNWTN